MITELVFLRIGVVIGDVAGLSLLTYYKQKDTLIWNKLPKLEKLNKKLPTSGPHVNYPMFVFQNAQNIVMNPKVIDSLVWNIGNPRKTLKYLCLWYGFVGSHIVQKYNPYHEYIINFSIGCQKCPKNTKNGKIWK